MSFRLEDSHFINCDFSQADFSHSCFAYANFGHVWISKCNLSHLKFVKCDFENADMSGIYIEDSNFVDADFTGTSFLGISFRRGRVKNSNFDNLCLNNVIFAYANMNDLHLKNNSTNSIQCNNIRLGHINTIESIGLPVITCLLEKIHFSKQQMAVQYWPTLDIATEDTFSGTLKEFEDHFINKAVISNKNDENMKKKQQTALTYIKAMVELNGFKLGE